MGINDKYAEKVISGRAPKKEKPLAPEHDDTISVEVPKPGETNEKAAVETNKTTAVKNLFSGMNLINWILAIGLVYAIYIAHQNNPKQVVENHLESIKEEIFALVDQRVESRLDEIPWQVREFAKVKPRPGQSLIMYWEKGEGPEIIDFDPARATERDVKLQGK